MDVFEASATGNIEELVTLLEKIDINAVDGYGWTALMHASSKGRLEAVKILLKNGANPNIERSNGITALMQASYVGNFEIVKLLLKYGADVTVQSKLGSTAVFYATGERHYNISLLLYKQYPMEKRHKERYQLKNYRCRFMETC